MRLTVLRRSHHLAAGDDAKEGVPEGSVFAAPEAAQGAACAAPSAYVWNLGIFLYVLLSGYQPFASTSTRCPFYAEFVFSKQLTCPPHFSTHAITLLCGMIVLGAEFRMSIPVSARVGPPHSTHLGCALPRFISSGGSPPHRGNRHSSRSPALAATHPPRPPPRRLASRRAGATCRVHD
eukprot:3154926-Prymnesium_polylepis.1